MLFAAIVRSGPAATRLTRTPLRPSSRARYREHDSRPALATPIQSYAGQATAASKSRPTSDPPFGIAGSTARASAANEYVDTCTVVATSSQFAVMKLPP